MLATKGPWNQSYNISGNEEVNLYDLGKYIIEKTGTSSKLNMYPEERAQPQQVKVDISAMKDIGFNPKINIAKGIDKMIKFYKKNPKAWQNYTDKGEQYYGK